MQRSSASDLKKKKSSVFLFDLLIYFKGRLGHMSDFMNLLGSMNWTRAMLSVTSASQ